MLCSLESTAIQDPVAFIGATTAMLREHFTKRWASKASEEVPPDSIAAFDASRSRYFIIVDRESLESFRSCDLEFKDCMSGRWRVDIPELTKRILFA
ncbi:uncharacterized protein BDV17DRAFT_270945 [Aspergillus undulatus]|uniref:uncharacterized protein n=1 Tax=Aspergillus undulatus TaxID=1810928 RepID=UPI003CCD5D7F